MTSEKGPTNIDWRRIALPALAMMLGLQSIRAIFPLLLYVLRDRFGWSAIQVGELAFVIFGMAFLLALLNRWLTTPRLLLLTGGGLALLRLTIQVWNGDPLVDFLLTAVAVVCFLLFWPAYGAVIHQTGLAGSGQLVIGIMTGLALDTAVSGFNLSYDLIWQDGFVPMLAVILLCGGFIALLWLQKDKMPPATDLTWSRAAGWLAWGPFLFLQLVLLHNIPALAALTSWSFPIVFGWILLGELLSVIVLLFLLSRPNYRIGALTLGLILIFLTYGLSSWPIGVRGAIFILGGQIVLALCLLLSLGQMTLETAASGLKRTTVLYGFSIILMTIFSFVYYAAYDIPLPITNTMLPPAAIIIIGFVSVWSARQISWETAVLPRWQPIAVTLLLLLIPWGQWILWPETELAVGDGFPVRVLNYNLHNGFNPDGDLDLETIAQTIEAQQPDIVGLQEVSRGWAVNGSVDMLTWLSQRLDMPFIYGPTTDPLWGNALLSRYPILEYELVPLPPEDLLLKRGVIHAVVDVGAGETLTVLVTHYHHIFDDHAIREIQSRTMVTNWPATGAIVLMGDFNAEPDWTELDALRAAAWQDGLDVAGISPGYTSPAPSPNRRIDYIWLSPDMRVDTITIVPDTGSDHLALWADVDLNK